MKTIRDWTQIANKRENSNTKRVSLLGPPCTLFCPIVQSLWWWILLLLLLLLLLFALRSVVLGDRVRLHLKPRLGQGTLPLQRRRQRVRVWHCRRCHGVLRPHHSARHRRSVREHQRSPAPQVRRHRRHGLLRSAAPQSRFSLSANIASVLGPFFFSARFSPV